MPFDVSSRPFLIAVGTFLFSAWVAREIRLRAGHSAQTSVARIGHWHARAERHYLAALFAITLAFACFASLAKFSQLRALALNAEDFWLFRDMLAQMLDGGFFITRFAPQAQGWVQHGVIHPYFTFALALPLAAWIGPTAAALLFGPFVFAGAGMVLGTIARPRAGALFALMAVIAFLASSQVSRILMYDVHPEAAYPLCVLLWAWAAGWGDGKQRPVTLLLATVLLVGIKIDSFTVILPLIAATALAPKLGQTALPSSRRAQLWLAVSTGLAIALSGLQSQAVHLWTSGAWGPATWRGQGVVIPHGADLLQGKHWDSLASAVAILKDLIRLKGGVIGLVVGLLKFLFSRPWLSLLLVAPWIATQPVFWVSFLPLAVVYSLLEDPGKFLNYYAAPLLGLFWLSAVTTPSRFKKPRGLVWIWMLCASLVLGGSGIDFSGSSPAINQTREDAQSLAGCLPPSSQGVVSGRFLSLVDPDRVRSDRVPSGELLAADFYLFSVKHSSYEIPPAIAQSLLERLQLDPHWNRIGKNCQPQGRQNPSHEIDGVLLFMKRQDSGL